MGGLYSQRNQNKTRKKAKENQPICCKREPKGVYWGMGSLEGSRKSVLGTLEGYRGNGR